ncbi:MAG: succinate dehydrogenase cytochrome b subunit [Ignavibacteriales bacterium]|nr:succinate dehydrogenase cytochrome b subunit [Ignavibacteriales bacterium]
MSWLLDRLNSSIGKKIIMAITGLSLLFFLVIHLVNNLLLFAGPEVFNKNVEQLESIKPIIRVVEVVLLLIFALHIYNALKLYFENKKAKPLKYAVDASSQNSTFYSRYMTVSGIIILVFLIIHLATFWKTFNFDAHKLEVEFPFYTIVQDAFANPIISIFYIVVMIFLGIHLNHAFQSAFQTFGLRNKKFTWVIEKFGTLIAIVITIGFASIPVIFYIASLGGK